MDLHTGSNDWSSPPNDLFSLRSPSLSRRQKLPSGDYLLLPAGVEWLRSSRRLDNLLSRPDNRLSSSLCRAHSLQKSVKAFIFALNLQIPGQSCHSTVFYFAAEEPIPPNSLLHRFIHGNDRDVGADVYQDEEGGGGAEEGRAGEDSWRCWDMLGEI